MSSTSIGPKEAADLVGRSKSAILKAIREGRISATKSQGQGWQIEPVELFRAYPDCAPRGAQPLRNSTPEVRRGTHPGTHPETQAEIDQLRERLRLAEQREADLVEERNAWREQAQRLALTDQRSAPRPGFWSRVFGK